LKKGRKLAVGTEAEIYEWDDGDGVVKVLKLYRGRDRQAKVERDIMRTIHQGGGAVPEVFGDVIEVDGRLGFLMEWVPEPSMAERIDTDPARNNLLRLGQQLGRLHASIHEQEPGFAVPVSRNAGLAALIERAIPITSGEKKTLLRMLSEIPEGDRTCHGDLHFGNVVGRKIIDWGHASTGDPMSDVAWTQLIITTCWKRSVHLDLHRGYTEGYFQESDADVTDVDRWRTLIAAARLGVGLPTAQAKDVIKLMRGD
jgi:thiamine kinase